MKCPICEKKMFIERKYDKNIRMINFEIGETLDSIDKSRKVFYECANCGYKPYGTDLTRLRRELKGIEEGLRGKNVSNQ